MTPEGVALIIPTYNRADLIAATVQSALAQTVPFDEIIVVDDGSTDHTQDVLRAFGGAITSVRQENAGVTAARAHGVARSSAPSLAFLDSDDLLDPAYVATHRAARALDPTAPLSICNLRWLIDGMLSSDSKYDHAPYGYWDDWEALGDGVRRSRKPMYRQLLRWQPLLVGTFVVARCAYDDIGGYLPHVGRWASEDFEFALRLGHVSPVLVIDRPLMQYRRHDQQATGNALHWLAGDIRILEHSQQHHPMGSGAASIIEHQVAARSADVADLAFAERDRAAFHSAWRRMSSQGRTTKRWIKWFLMRFATT